MKESEGRQAALLSVSLIPPAPQWAAESRGSPGRSEGSPDGLRCTHTNTHIRTPSSAHSLSRSHVICYPICTITKLPVTPGPCGGYTHTHAHTTPHTKVTDMYVDTQQRCSQCVTGGEDSCSLSCSLELAPTRYSIAAHTILNKSP